MRKHSLFPPGTNLVKDVENLVLLHCHYYKSEDTLFLLYKNSKTGEKILDKIYEPTVPVFIAKMKPERNLEYIPIRLTDRIMVSYKDKANEVKEELFDYKVVKYKDKRTGRMMCRKIFPDLPRRAEALHPSLFYYDVPIEQICMTEFAINHYKEDGKLQYEHIDMPKLDFAAFDIETTRWPDGHWSINTNTFIDQKSGDAYLDFVYDPEKYARQREIIDNIPKFIQNVKDEMEKAIEGSILKNPSEKAKVQKICRDLMSTIKFHIRPFKTESDLILETTKTMFTTYKPDILMAYNTTYDLGMFADRVRELELPNGTMNERGVGYDDILPPYDNDHNRDNSGKFMGDVAVPKKRKVFLNNISHTILADLQTAYYSARQGSVFSSYKLDSLATMVLGFGKFDFQNVCKDILKLAEADFWVHSTYALIDSILLLMINAVTNEFESKMTYVYRSKCNIEDTSQSNSTITRAFHTDAYALKGMVPGNNINKVIKSMSKADVKKASDIIGVDFTKNWESIVYRQAYGGGIVSSPNLYDFDFDEFKPFNVLNNEAHLTMFKKMLNLLYLDFKSHYPNTIITRNISKGTLFGTITSVVTKYGEYLLTRDKQFKDQNIWKPHLGSITLAMANNDIISYASKTCGMPTLSEIAGMFVPLDSEPLTEPIKTPQYESDLPTKYHKLCSLLTKLNQLRFTKTDEESVEKDNKLFMFTNGNLVYCGTRVHYDWNGKDLIDCVGLGRPTDDTWYYGTFTKKRLVSSNEKCNQPKHPKFEFSGEWKHLDNDVIRDISKMTLFSEYVTIDGQKLLLSDRSLYYPIDHKIKQLDNTLAKGKNVYVGDIEYRNEVLEKTTKWELRYNIEYEDIKLTIYQQMQTVNLE